MKHSHSPKSWRHATTVVTLFAASCLTSQAWAAAAEAADATDFEGEAAYRKVIQDGVAEYEAGRFAEARSLFQRAHQMSPNARTYRGIGMTSFELRDYVSAVRNLSAALLEMRKPLSPEQRKHAQGLLDHSRVFVDILTVKLVPSTAQLTVNGRDAEFERDGTLILGYGVYRLAASAPGMTTRWKEIDVRGGVQREVTIALEPALGHSRPMSAPEVFASPSQALAPLPPSRKTALTWLLVSGAAVLIGAGTGVIWYVEQSELSDCSRPPQYPERGYFLRCTNPEAVRSARDLARGVTIGTGIAALTMATVGAIKLSSSSPKSALRTALVCTPTLGGAMCGWEF